MNVQELAKAMNVTELDVSSLLKMVADSIVKDVMSEIFLNMSESERVEVTGAYIQAEVKKFFEFCVTLLTNQEKRSAFVQHMFAQLKA